MGPATERPPVRRSWPRRALNRLEVDRAVFYAVAGRAWQLLAGPVSMVLIAFTFTAEVQGYYYTFASLLALQSFVELGLHVVLINLASHEWARLDLRQSVPSGDAVALARLGNLARQAVRWYGLAAVIFMIGAGAFGAFFFSRSGDASVSWRLPWFAAVVLSGLSLWFLPRIALLEGCNQVVTVNRMRVVQGVTATLAVWAAILAGAQLWAVVVMLGVKLGWEAWLVLFHYRPFFLALAEAASGPHMDWRLEVWPLQWRMSVQAVFGYFGYSLLTPVMMWYHDAATAGRMGMTWTVLTSLQAAALAWVQTRTPRFGMMASLRQFAELDRIFLRLTTLSLGIVALAVTAFWVAVVWLNALADYYAEALPVRASQVVSRLADRLLPPLPTALLALTIILLHVPHCQSIYIRAHKVDPFLWLSSTTSVLIGLLVWQLGSRFGPTGATAGYLGVTILATVPGYTVLWLRCRRELHYD